MFVFILCYIVLVLIRPQDYQPGLVGTPLLQVSLMLAFAFWLLGRRKDFSAPQYPLLVGFLGAMMMSMVTNGWTGGALYQLTAFGPIVLAFAVLAGALNSEQRIRRTLETFVLCAVALAVHGIQQANTGTGWTGMGMSSDGRIQYVGIFNDPNDLGLLFVMAVPMALHLSKGGLLRRLLGLAATGALLYGIVLTNSRGSLLALVVIAGTWLWLKRGLVTAIALGVPGLLGLMLLPSRLQDLDAGESSAAGRVDAWYEGFQMFFSHPLFGVGAGNFTEYNYLTAHNSFVLVLAETGFVGFTLWLAFVVYCFRMMYSMVRYVPAQDATGSAPAWRDERALATTLLLSLTGFFSAAFFLSRSYVILLYLLAAVVVGFHAWARERHPALPAFPLAREWLRCLVMSAVGVVALFIVVRILLVTQ